MPLTVLDVCYLAELQPTNPYGDPEQNARMDVAGGQDNIATTQVKVAPGLKSYEGADVRRMNTAQKTFPEFGEQAHIACNVQ